MSSPYPPHEPYSPYSAAPYSSAYEKSQPPHDPYRPHSVPHGQPTHSVIGMLSLASSVLFVVATFMLFGLIGYFVATMGADNFSEESVEAMIVGLGLFTCWGIGFFSIVLGIVGVCQPYTNKLFPILGIVISSLVLLGTFGLMVLGLVAS